MELSKINESIVNYQNHMSYGNTYWLTRDVMKSYVLKSNIETHKFECRPEIYCRV